MVTKNKPKSNFTNLSTERNQLLTWYLKNKRDLPWRKNRDPYLIWISEVMLQQTTVTAVRPFYEKFVLRFPDISVLAKSRIEDIYEYWAGLGYYSRARNLHKSAQKINALIESGKSFPQTASELIELPGFGPYTSRAVASLAFNERVGVLDGNVIRILTRFFGLDLDWWSSDQRHFLQTISDQFADCSDSPTVNQALMELGATICTPKKPLCVMCPWIKNCQSFADGKVLSRPRSKPKPDYEMWLWTFYLQKKNGKIYLTENNITPFLKKLMLPPSTAVKIKQKPKTFHFKHSVTKYDLFIQLETKKVNSNFKTRPSVATTKWVDFEKVSQINPTSLMKKILLHQK
jgi:A/G-specific adenine glycosylase